MRTIAVCNGKGGCGKSTIATALVAECTRRGLRSLLVDCDAPQYTALRWSKVGRGQVAAVAVTDATTIAKVGAGWDRVIVDTAGRDDALTRGVMLVADLVVVPVQPTQPDLWAAADAIGLVKAAQGLNPRLQASLVISRADGRTTASREIRGALANAGTVLQTQIHQRTDYPNAMAVGEGPTTFAPNGKAAAEVRALFEELHHAQAKDFARSVPT